MDFLQRSAFSYQRSAFSHQPSAFSLAVVFTLPKDFVSLAGVRVNPDG